MIMEKYKCEKNVYGRQCDESFNSESQLNKHVSSFHKKYTVDKIPEPKIKPILNIWSGEMVTWDPMERHIRNRYVNETCVVGCGNIAYTMEHGQPHCYGHWATWGCHYSKSMIDHDRKWFKMPCRNRNTYDARPLTKKERKKTIKQIVSLEHEVWARMSWTPLDELEKWHDDKLRREVRSLEYVRANPC